MRPEFSELEFEDTEGEDMEDMVSEFGGSGIAMGMGGGAGISSYSSLLDCLMDGTSYTLLLDELAILKVLDFMDPLELLEPEKLVELMTR